jgi:hypothetical protein
MGLVVGSINVNRALARESKQEQLKAILQGARPRPDLVAVQEHGEEEGGAVVPHTLGDFTYLGRPRPKGTSKKGGGAAWYVHSSLLAEVELVDAKVARLNYGQAQWLKVPGSGRSKPLFMGSVYMPTMGTALAEVQTAWQQLQSDVLALQTKGNVVVLGDLNARVGSAGGEGEVIGKWGEKNSISVPNEHGRYMLQFLNGTNLISAAGRTADQASQFTWGRGDLRTVVDYVLLPGTVLEQGVDTSVSVEITPEDFSDHNLLLHTLQFRTLRMQPTARTKIKKWNLNKLHEQEVLLKYRQALRDQEGYYLGKIRQIKSQLQQDISQLPGGQSPASLVQAATQTLAQELEAIFVDAADNTIGSKTVVPGKSKGYWDSELSEACAKGRQLYTTYCQARQDVNQTTAQVQACYQGYAEHTQVKKKLLKQKKQAFDNHMMEGLNTLVEKAKSNKFMGNKMLWKGAKSILGLKLTRQTAAIKEPGTQGVVRHTDQGIADAFWVHHKNLSDPDQNDLENQFADKASFHRQVEQEVSGYHALSKQPAGQGLARLNEEELSNKEVVQVLSELKNGKAGAPGSQLVNELLRYGEMGTVGLVQPLLQFMWEWETKPEDYKKGYICSVFKAGDTLDTNNYRGLTLLNVVGKLYSKIINARLVEEFEAKGLFSNAQNGFRPNRNCADHILSLSETLLGRLRQRKSTYLLQTDCYKAYDTVWRDGLFYRLWQMGVRGKMWRVLKDMYQGTTSTTVQNGQLSSKGMFDVELGLAQGDPLSPTLYLIFINSLLEEIDSKCEGVSLGPGVQLVAQMFADDFTGLADSPEAVDSMILVIKDYCSRWRIKMNPAKCAVLVVGTEHAECKRLGRSWYWGTELIPMVDSLKYLGVMISYDMNWDVHADMVLKKAERASFAIWSALGDGRIKLFFRRLLLTALVKPVMEHACEIWEPSQESARKLQSFYSKLQRRMMNCPKSVAQSILGAELGCQPLTSCRQQRRVEAAKRVQAMGTNRLPKLTTTVDWGKNSCRGRPKKLWGDRAKAVVSELNIDLAQHVDTGKAVFKKLIIAKTAGRDLANMKVEAGRHSSVAAYLELEEGASGRQLCHYLDSDDWQGAQLMFQCRASCLPLNGLTGKWRRQTSRIRDDGTLEVIEDKNCKCCDKETEESLGHFLLECSKYDSGVGKLDRKDFLKTLKGLAGDQKFAEWDLLPKVKKLQKLLKPEFWGKKGALVVTNVGYLVQRFLKDAWSVREEFCSACGDTGRVANGLMATAHM